MHDIISARFDYSELDRPQSPVRIRLNGTVVHWLIPVVWIGMVFASEASKVIIRAFATELFPTGHRSTSSGWLALLEAIGAALGLLMLGISQRYGVSTPDAVTLIGLACLVGGALILRFPETRQQELEALNE